VNAIETAALSRRFRRTWALRDCYLAIPAGHVAALVGPNGAGKTTLLHMAVGLTNPTAGSVTVLDGQRAGSPAARHRVAFVAQDAPLYKNLSAADMLHLTRNLNWRWDAGRARARLSELGIPLAGKVGKLSGGQQAQLALTLALARRPDLLILDEPLARLDPLARHDFLASLMAAVAEDGISVVFSSHVVSELERVADYLIVLSRGRVQVAGEVEELLAGHRLLTGPAGKTEEVAKRLPLVHAQCAQRQAQLLVRTGDAGALVPEGFESHRVGLEELVLSYLREPDAAALAGPQAPAGTAVPAALNR
jgi:ABC-2 type transport system ATP-binding protein